MPFENPKSLGLRVAGTGPSVLETVIGGASQAVDAYIDGQDKNRKREKDKIDTYISLRKAGYKPGDAARVVQSGEFSAPLVDGESDFDLDQRLKNAQIKEIDAKTDYYTRKGTSPEVSAGFDNPDDIPENLGGLPLKKISQNKTTGKYFGEYGSVKADTLGTILSEQDNQPSTTPSPSKSTWSFPDMLNGIINKFKKPTQPNTTTTETKVVQGVTYKRGTDGKWHKQ